MSVRLDGVQARRLDVPPLVGAVIDKAIAWRPDDRFPTAAAMASALRTAWLTTFGVHLHGPDGHLATIGRVLADPPRHSGITRIASAVHTVAMPASLAATTHPTTTRPMLPPLPPLAPPVRAPIHSPVAAPVRRGTPRPLLVLAAVLTVLVAMTSGIAFARLIVGGT